MIRPNRWDWISLALFSALLLWSLASGAQPCTGGNCEPPPGTPPAPAVVYYTGSELLACVLVAPSSTAERVQAACAPVAGEDGARLCVRLDHAPGPLMRCSVVGSK